MENDKNKKGIIANNLIVHRATEGEAVEIAPLFDQYRTFYGQSADVEGAAAYLQKRLSCGESIILILRNKLTGEIAAFTQLYPSFSSISMRNIWILNDLFVVESYRKQGLARKLLEAARAFAAETGAKGLALSTAKTNETAQRLYESIGYERDEAFYHYFYSI